MTHILWAFGIVIGVVVLFVVLLVGGLLWQTRGGKWNN